MGARRLVKKILLGLVAALGVALGAAWLYVDEFVGHAIERGGTAALGVEIRVGFVRISPFDGELRVNRLAVENPPGFDTTRFLRVKRGQIDADLSTLEDEVVEVPYLALEHVEVSLERDGHRTNYGVILDNVKNFEASDAADPPEGGGSQKRYVVRKVSIRDIVARVEWSRFASNQTAVSVVIPEIEIHDVGARDGRGVAMGELTSIFTKAILGSIARYGVNLPSAVRSGLESGLGGLARVTGVVVTGAGSTLVDVAAGVATELGEGEVGNAVRSVGGDAVKSVGNVGREALDGLLGVVDAGGNEPGGER